MSDEKLIFEIFQNDFKINPIKIEKNQESSDGNVYLIECENKKYIAKVYEDRKHAQSMVNLHNMLIKYGINVPHIAFSKYDVENKNKFIVVYSFIEGKVIKKTLENGRIPVELLPKIAMLIRTMHNMTSEKNIFDLPEISFDENKKRRTLLHFDLTKDNIFLDDKDQIAIIDFDDAKYGSAIYDISILISTFFFSEIRGVDKKGMKIFLDEYYGEDASLKNEEMPMIKRCAIQWIDYLINNNRVNSSLIESFKKKRELIEENL